ncbi:hypothetical protein [Gordonia malaquae]|uniref:hypothetical protein n=1 Tax=Gordonia malaquae TaxID=410332 RepID=UPI003015D2B2
MSGAVPPAFLTVQQLESQWRGLTTAEKTLAESLLDSAGVAIREAYREARGVDIDDAHPAAVTVSFDMVRTAISTGAYAGHTAYSRTEGPRAKGGTLIAPGGSLELTDWHRKQLGLPIGTLAQAYFDDCSDARY